MRFAVRRPGIPEASPRSHGMPCRDVHGRVHVRVAGEFAGYTSKDRLALAVLRCYVATRRATLRGEGRTNLFDSHRCFIQQPPTKGSPTGSEYFSVEPGFRRHPASWVRHIALGAPHHPLNREVFEEDHIETTCDSRRRLLAPILPGVTLSGAKTRNGGLELGPAFRVPTGSRESTLKVAQPPLALATCAWHVQQLAGGQGCAHRHTAVDADHGAIARPCYRFRNGWEQDVPPACAVTSHAIGPRATWHWTRPAESNPSRLRYPDLSDVAGEPPNSLRLRTDDPEALIPASLAPARQPANAAKEIAHCLGEIPERLLLNGLRTCGKPVRRRAGLGQLSALIREARRCFATGTPMPVLLASEVPNKPCVSAMASHDLGLPLGRCEPVTVHKSNVVSATDILEEVTRSDTSRPNTELSAPRYL